MNEDNRLNSLDHMMTNDKLFGNGNDQVNHSMELDTVDSLNKELEKCTKMCSIKRKFDIQEVEQQRRACKWSPCVTDSLAGIWRCTI